MTTEPDIFFDASLPTFVRAIDKHLGANSLKHGVIVRDTSGRLRFLSPDASPTDESRRLMEKELAAGLGAYARIDDVVAFGDEPGVHRLLKDTAAFQMQEGLLSFRLLDRRIIGSAWLDVPEDLATAPPRIVFASLKGGVGRSTALSVAASDLSRRNKNVLVVDLDLEAPGIGEILLTVDRIPRFGTVDYLVENGLGGIPDKSLTDFIGTSSLTSPTGGRVDVLPALGKNAIDNPANVLPKLSRAMLEDVDANGTSVAVTTQIAEMIRRFTERESYDVVLVDTRAGLAEIAAPAILGLGATVLLFGTAQRQTIQGYKALFAGLKLLAERDTAAGKSAEWRLLFKAVYAKAGLDEAVGALHRDELYELFADNLYDVDDIQQAASEAMSFDIDDDNAPHWPLVIPFTQNFVDFDPVRAPSQLNAAFYEQAYRPFLNGIDSIVTSSIVPLNGSETKQ